MHDDVSRLLGIEGMAVTGVADHGWRLELEVETLAGVGCCRWCGRGSLKVKERDRVRVRDLPGAGRMTYLCWCKRRFWCEAWARTFTETHPALPSRQRVSARFAAHLFDRCQAVSRMLRSRAMSTRAATRSRAFGRGDELLAGVRTATAAAVAR